MSTCPLRNIEELVDEYVADKLTSIFIRPLTPLGFAESHWSEIGYSAEEFVGFYRNALAYIIELNKKGVNIKEGHAELFLSKILMQNGGNYMELRSPCGAIFGQMAYYYNGDIFTCDEGRMLYQMGDDAFKIGNVYEDSYQSIVQSIKCENIAKSTILESLPGCTDCVYMPYCGVCPVMNYALEGDLITRTFKNYRCAVYMGMLDCIFENVDDPESLKVFESWVD